ncbi:MAG: hypothetical protein ACO1OF_15540 [Adhaeribacter sp.]
MSNLFSTRIAAIGLLLILSLIVIFHLLVMVGVIPFNIVWGGRLKSTSEMLLFETISIFMNLIMLAVVAIKANILRLPVNRIVIQVAL